MGSASASADGEPDGQGVRLPGAVSLQRLKTAPVATALIDPEGRVQEWSEAAEALTGYRDAEIIGRDAALLGDAAEFRGKRFVRAVLRSAGSVRTDWLRRGDGTCRSISWQPVAVPLSGGTGVLAIAVVSGAQLTEFCDAVAADRLLQSAPFGLAVLDTDLRFRFINQANARLNRISVAQHLGRSILEVMDLPDPVAYEAVLRRIVDRGETVEDLRVAAIGPDGEPFAAVGTLFPLRDGAGAVVGVGGLVRELVDTDGEVLDAARGRRQLELLDRVSARLGQGLDPRTVAMELAAACVPEVADGVAVDLLARAVKPVTADTADTAETEGLAADARTCPPPDCLVHHLTLRPQEPRPRTEDALPSPRPALPAVAACLDSAQPVAFEGAGGGRADVAARYGLAVPLVAVGRLLGAVTFLRQAGPFSSEAVLLAREIAARTATAIDNALRYRRERLAALALQRHLLPARLPSANWFQLAYRYHPAEDDNLAGGDWYDAVALPGGRIGLGIGDVMGHGVAAAAAMGRYRASVHALLSVGMPPGPLLTRLDALFTGSDGELAATCACVVYDGGTGRCRIALAGHPPALLLRPDGSVCRLPCDAGPPLGMDLRHVYRDREHRVPPGSVLVLYTDGMIEDRSALLDLDQGIELLSRAVRDPRAPLNEVCDALMAARPASSVDDAALLVARLGQL
ncbi:SpoIIE family protein phosphatase [Streptomyces sp. NPDC006463]|uniref:SpoIIE family protein phosphatase n=1 Tax=Streptomyces sp. NPDC006463 TaxID=3364746 RepID=UPI00367D0989